MATFSVGGLLTEYRLYPFESVISNHIELSHAPMIQDMSSFKRAEHVHALLARLLHLTPDEIWQLTLGDIVYILTLLRAKCYTQTPVTVTWDCHAKAYSDEHGIVFDQHVTPEYAKEQNYFIVECDRTNSELIYSYNYAYAPKMMENYEPHPEFHVPTLRDQYLLDELSDADDWPQYKMFSKFLLCCEGKTIEEKKDALSRTKDFRAASKFLKSCEHGVEYSYTLKCATCDSRPQIKKMLDIYSVLPVIDQESIMNIQYTVLREFKAYLPEETPVMKALYWHNLMKKEAQERAAKRKQKTKG